MTTKEEISVLKMRIDHLEEIIKVLTFRRPVIIPFNNPVIPWQDPYPQPYYTWTSSAGENNG